MKKLLLACSLLLLTTTAAVRADDFPGKGNRADWQQAEQHYNEGVQFEDHQQFPLAIPKFKEAIAIYPYDGTYFHHLGRAYGKTGDTKDALIMLEKASQLRRREPWKTWAKLSDLYYAPGQYPKATEALKRALRTCPPDRRKALTQNLAAIQKKLH